MGVSIVVYKRINKMRIISKIMIKLKELYVNEHNYLTASKIKDFSIFSFPNICSHKILANFDRYMFFFKIMSFHFKPIYNYPLS